MVRNESLINGSETDYEDFEKRFKEIVGCTYNEWLSKPDIKDNSGSDWYYHTDGIFICSGSNSQKSPSLLKIKSCTN